MYAMMLRQRLEFKDIKTANAIDNKYRNMHLNSLDNL